MTARMIRLPRRVIDPWHSAVRRADRLRRLEAERRYGEWLRMFTVRGHRCRAR